MQSIVADPPSAAFATNTRGHRTVWGAVAGDRLAQPPDTGYRQADLPDQARARTALRISAPGSPILPRTYLANAVAHN